MGMVCEKGVITASTVNGTAATISLGSKFNGILPKFIIMWTSFTTSHAAANANGIWSMGMGTYHGSVVQQHFIANFNQDAATTSVCAHGIGTDSILKGLTANDTTYDFDLDLNSFTSGTPSQVSLTWTTAPASAILVHYMVFGGSDINAAYAGGYTVTVGASQDVTITSGFGKPDLVMFLGHGYTSAVSASQNARTLIGVTDRAERAVSSTITFETGSATMALASMVSANAIYYLGAGTAVDGIANLAADKGVWPTDGFRMNYSADNPSLAFLQSYLALDLTADARYTFGRAVMPTTPQKQTIKLPGGVPAGAMFWNVGAPQSTAIYTGAAAFTHFGCMAFGGSDGVNEGWAAHADQDTNTAAQACTTSSNTKAIGLHIASGTAGSLEAEADCTFSGQDVWLDWTDASRYGVEYLYFVLGTDDTTGVAAKYVEDIGTYSSSEAQAVASGVPGGESPQIVRNRRPNMPSFLSPSRDTVNGRRVGRS